MTIHALLQQKAGSLASAVMLLAAMSLLGLLLPGCRDHTDSLHPAAALSPAVPPSASPTHFPTTTAAASTAPTVHLITCETVAAAYEKIVADFPISRLPADPHWRSSYQMFALQVDSPENPMLQQPIASVTSRRDNLGTDLSNIPTSDRGEFFPLESNLSFDHRHAFVFLRFTDVPARGATLVTLEGKVVMRCAAHHKSVVLKNIPFHAGATFQIAGRSFLLNNIATRYGKTVFTITASGDPAAVPPLRFLDAQTDQPFATLLSVDPAISGKYELRGSTTKPPAAMNIDAEPAQGEETHTIPFRFVVSVGGSVDSAASPAITPAPKMVATKAPPATGASTALHIEITPVGLRIDDVIDQKRANEWFGGRGSFAAFRRPATKLWLLVHSDRPILKSSMALYSASTFTDDRGTVLRGFEPDKKPADMAPEIKGLSNDGLETTIGILSNSLPAAGARYLLFKGTLTLQLAAAPATTEIKGVSMTVGTHFQIGDRTCTITNVYFSPKTGAMAMYVRIPGSIDGVGNLTFLDSDGKVLDDITPSTQFRPEFTRGSFLHVSFPRLVENATVRSTSRSGGKTITVPINVKVPLGL